MKNLLLSLKKGKMLSKKETNKLYRKLGFKFSFWNAFFFALMILGILSICFGLNYQNEKNFILVVLGSLVFVFGYIANKNIFKYDRLTDYFEALNIYVEGRFMQYKGFNIYYIKNIVSTSNAIETNKVFFLTDGFNFMVFNDFFTLSYTLPKEIKGNMLMRLPIYNADFIDSNPFLFTYNDIIGFKLVGRINTCVEIYRSQKLSKEVNEKLQNNDLLLDQALINENYVYLTLLNGTSYKLDTSLYDVLRELIPLKEGQI